jgi:GTP-binding protein
VFVDEVEVEVCGGKGGDGCISFLREKYVPRGGPDGGDGGTGGAVILLPTNHRNTLHRMARRRVYAAGKGQPGSGKECAGRRAEDLVLEVPVGTQVIDAERGNVLKDLDRPGEPFTVARGGHGGRGNARFASATNRTPTHREVGHKGEERRVLLRLKLIADVGLVGLPNAGKSTLLATVSHARPRIADYPFTTLEPSLGIVDLDEQRSLVVADIPGLIEGAHQGKGLGDKFLRHVERTRVLLHLVDCSSAADEEPVQAWRVIRGELQNYSPALAERPYLLVATKVEDDDARGQARTLEDATGTAVYSISAATGFGLKLLLEGLAPFARDERR